MNKLNLSAVSLVAALPAGVLVYLLVMVIAWDPGIDKIPGFLKVVVGLALLVAALLALMPIGIFLFVGRSKKADTGPVAGRRSAKAGAVAAVAAGAGAAALAADEFATDEETDEDSEAADEFDDGLESDEFTEDEFAADEFESNEEGDLFGSDDGFDAFEMDDEDETK